MISRYEAYMDGIALSSVNPKLLILDIAHAVSAESLTTDSIINRNGLILQKSRRAKTSVSILFELRIYDIAERQQALQEVQRWASGKVLETNDRKGQQLYVHCDSFPVISSALKWTDELQMTFSSYEKPFWLEKTPAVLTLAAGTSGSGTLYVPGNAGKALVEVTVTPSSGTMANCTLTVAGRTITLTGVNATASNPLTIRYDDMDIQSIKVGTTSVLDKRTGVDDLLAECGKTTAFSFTASSSASVSFSVKGVWL